MRNWFLCTVEWRSVHAVAEDQRLLPNRRVPAQRGLSRIHQTFRDTGTLCGVHVTAECEVKMWWTRKLVQLVETDLGQIREELQDVLKYGEHRMQKAEWNISDLVILLRGWNFATGSVEVAVCIVTSYTWTKCNSIPTLSVTNSYNVWSHNHTTVEVTSRYVSLSLCGV